VRSSDGPGTTIIDGGAKGPTVKFFWTQTPATLLQGFTVRDGSPGIFVSSASPTIVGNVVTGNNGSTGGGLYVGRFETGLVKDNLFRSIHARDGGPPTPTTAILRTGSGIDVLLQRGGGFADGSFSES
jgi:hypothetical protein